MGGSVRVVIIDCTRSLYKTYKDVALGSTYD